MSLRKNNSGLILSESFIAELKGLLDIGNNGCRITPRKSGWIDALLDNFGLGGLTSGELGTAYEQIHSDRKQRKKDGIFYTPPEVVRMILDETNDGWCLENPGRLPRILEPSCGAGAFAIGVLDKLHRVIAKGDGFAALPESVGEYLHVNDLDPGALAAATMCILRKLSELNQSINGNIRLRATSHDFLDTKLWFNADGPDPDDDGYDIIIGNPPYISYYAKGSQGITEEQRAEWSKHFISAKGRVNTYLMFIEMAIKLLKPGGRLGFIIPNTFLVMKSYEKVRRLVLDTCHVRYIADLSAGIFPGVEVPCCVVVFEKRDPSELALDHSVKVMRPAFESGSEEISLDTGRFRELPYFMFNVGMDRKTCEILDRMESASEQLKAFVDVRDGINPANVKKKIVVPEKDGPNFKPVLVGRDIKPFSLEWSGLFVNYDADAIDKSKGEYCFLREERIFLAEEKLVNRQTSRRLVAALDSDQYYALNSCHLTLIEDERLDIRYLLALYNSDLLNFYYASVFRDTEKVFPQVKTVNIEKLPLKFGEPEVLAGIVEKAVELSNNNLEISRRTELIEDISAKLTNIYGLSDTQMEYMRKRVPR